jgi:hypothetical protein
LASSIPPRAVLLRRFRLMTLILRRVWFCSRAVAGVPHLSQRCRLPNGHPPIHLALFARSENVAIVIECAAALDERGALPRAPVFVSAFNEIIAA